MNTETFYKFIAFITALLILLPGCNKDPQTPNPVPSVLLGDWVFKVSDTLEYPLSISQYTYTALKFKTSSCEYTGVLYTISGDDVLLDIFQIVGDKCIMSHGAYSCVLELIDIDTLHFSCSNYINNTYNRVL